MSLILLALGAAPAAMQDQTTVIVPDVTGLNVPQAAAALHRFGLMLGEVETRFWSEEESLRPHVIAAQFPASGTVADTGARVNLTVLRPANALLIYDDNDITLINNTGGSLDLSALVFVSLRNADNDEEPGVEARFQGARWRDAGAEELAPGECAQLWSVGRAAPKPLIECERTIYWLTTNEVAEHFWMYEGAASSFVVFQAGVERALCGADTTSRCALFLGDSSFTETTDYLYLSYTTDSFVVHNLTEDRWMPLHGIRLRPLNGGEPFNLLNLWPAVYEAALWDYGYGLAPGQCAVLRRMTTDDSLLPSCDVVAQRILADDTDLTFWLSSYAVIDSSGNERVCMAAPFDRSGLCLLPR